MERLIDSQLSKSRDFLIDGIKKVGIDRDFCVGVVFSRSASARCEYPYRAASAFGSRTGYLSRIAWQAAMIGGR